MSKCVVSAVWFLPLSLAVCSAEEAGLMGVSPIICTDVYSLFFDGLKWDLCLLSCYPRPYSLSFCFFSFFLCWRSLVAFRFYAAGTSLIVNICFYVTSPFMGYLGARKDGLVSKSFHLRLVWFFSMQSGNLQIANRNLCLGSTLYYI